MYKLPTVSESEARWRCGVWIGSIEASDVHLIGTPLVKASGVTAQPERQRFEAKAVGEMQGTPWRPSTNHRGAKMSTHNRQGRPRR